ncbi:MAG: TetR/AcrR family transcriptional regulator [Syntrophomonadaceae bacterium]|nr:TetR/AcrR family transcriptional regulator [Bacillota bacterium]NLP23337.1 TetR/AcrR family transcriptional regulator [Syntrophomonadaceae bacterium]
MNNKDTSTAGNTRQVILQTANRLMMDQGINNTSLNDIAREAGISKGTLHYYYPSKDDLIYDIAQQHFSVVKSSVLRWNENVRGRTSFAEILRVVLSSFLEADTRNKLHLYLLQEAVVYNEHIRQRFQESYQEWRTLLKEELDLQSEVLGFNESETRALSFIIVAIIDGLLIQRIVGGDIIPLDDIVEFLDR